MERDAAIDHVQSFSTEFGVYCLDNSWKEAANVAWHTSSSLSQLLHSSLTGKLCLWPIFLLGRSLGCAQVWIPFFFFLLFNACYFLNMNKHTLLLKGTFLCINLQNVCLHSQIHKWTNKLWQVKYNRINRLRCFSAVITAGSPSKKMRSWVNRKKITYLSNLSFPVAVSVTYNAAYNKSTYDAIINQVTGKSILKPSAPKCAKQLVWVHLLAETWKSVALPWNSPHR